MVKEKKPEYIAKIIKDYGNIISTGADVLKGTGKQEELSLLVPQLISVWVVVY